MSQDREPYDDVVWEKNETEWEKTELQFRYKKNHRKIGSLIQDILAKPGKIQPGVMGGAYNQLYRMSFSDGSEDVLLRIPCLGVHTSVPIPRLYYCGLSEENPTKLGPFLILGYIKSYKNLSDILAAPDKPEPWDPDTLDLAVPDETLRHLYGQIATQLLELAELEFSRIGSLVPVGDRHDEASSVAARPLTQNMNDMRYVANIPPAVLPPEWKTFTTANDWYIALADMHFAQLLFQRNDFVQSLDDGRTKYIARLLFRRLAKEGKLSTFGFQEDTWSAQARNSRGMTHKAPDALAPAPSGQGPFRLWCDDLRAGNILFDENKRLAAIIDWEFTYAAPAQFILDPPWWLLLAEPEKWPEGILSWASEYEQRLPVWIQAMEAAEEEQQAQRLAGTLKSMKLSQLADQKGAAVGAKEPVRLSVQMRQSWEQGRFWLNYAARKSWVFDAIYWRFLDKRFFGEPIVARSGRKDDLWKTRVDLLTDEERENSQRSLAVDMGAGSSMGATWGATT
ncbi:hypothetical protein GQ53DRAFT_854515 [Thozetella sp. PMI_491]|nr:hypothetical protein GQ53DRAFT_854515 [Thozetella sp. PMI_491]